tara:strand:- start:1068 stop:1295 length:228 start_codon:yes stop_codon:yes gene_type:complete
MMEEQQLNNWRDGITADLTEVKTDVKWIKDNLGRMDVRQADLAKQVSWLKGVGSIVGVILASVLALVGNIVFNGD